MTILTALPPRTLLLGMDTCGSPGSVALGLVTRDAAGLAVLTLARQSLLAGGDFAATLVSSIAALLDAEGATAKDLSAIVVVVGPGSFTGIRVGLAATKAMAEAWSLPVIAVSRLIVLAKTASAALGSPVRSAVLDAHRGQVYCGLGGDESAWSEMLLTAGEINSMGGLPRPAAVCEEAVAQLVETLMELEPVRVPAPTAWDALEFILDRWLAGSFSDVASLDGYYLRGADAKVPSRPG